MEPVIIVREVGSDRASLKTLGSEETGHEQCSLFVGRDSVRSMASSRSAVRVASHILSRKEPYADLVKHPAKANLPDGSPLLENFRHVFEALAGPGESAGVTAVQLESALQSFAKALPQAVGMRIQMVVSEVFEEAGVSMSGKITWPDFERLLHDRDVTEADRSEALSQLFELCDGQGTGYINALDLMTVLLLVSDLTAHHDPCKTLTEDVAHAIVRDLDCMGQGGISQQDFMEVVQASRASGRAQRAGDSEPASGNSPHLVLHFDVNNTIVMLDSATGADTRKLLGAVFANSAWGVIQQGEEGKPKSWVLTHTEISILAPERGLTTYKEFVDFLNPVEAAASKEQKTRAKLARRHAAWSFTDPGQPGERFRPQLEALDRSLQLSEEIRGSPAALAAGLKGNTVQILPSFLHMLHELKRQGRTFTLFFRTFGHDLELVQQELNALCEGRHPLFPGDVVLDGSDGCPDYRMYLDRPQSCGTFFRDPAKEEIALIMGTTSQPRTSADFPGFYEDFKDVALFRGHHEVIPKILELSGQRRTIALGDHYAAWFAQGLKSKGGKPFFLSWYDNATHSIFFDDNITASDPKIVDPINAHHWPRRFCNPQLLGVHLVQAQPLSAISNRDYFLECISKCETARKEKLERWNLTQRLIGDLAGIQQVLHALVSWAPRAEARFKTLSEFQPWCMTRRVSMATQADTFDEHLFWALS